MLKASVLFCYPWDFRDEGVGDLVRRARDLGLTHLAVATSYHAGYFFHPHNPRRKVHLLEDGVVYFHPDEGCYGDGPIRPIVAEMSRERDWIRTICDAALDVGLKMVSWTVLLHNTRQGLLHPEATIANAFGDRHPHALSPAHPASLGLSRGLVRDLAAHYPFEAIMLEAPNYRNRAHGGTWVSGHHHERNGTHLRPLEMRLLDLSFNEADVLQAQAAGVDVATLRAAVRDHLVRYFEQAPDVPEDLPRTIEQFRDRNPQLTDMEAHYDRAERALLAALGREVRPHGVKLIGSAKPPIDIVMAGAYGAPVESIARMTKEARAALEPGQQLLVALRMGFTSPGMGTPIVTEQQMVDASRAVCEHGADMIAYYNYAEAPARCVSWIGPALRSGILAGDAHER